MEKEILCKVYEQYWQHARHAENNTWLYTSTSSIIMGAVIAVMGAEIPEEMKTGVALFGAILSLLGFGVVYANRVPFLKFTHIAELIAINEFGIKDEYRRFFPGVDEGFPKDKWFDLHDILATFYSLLTGMMFYFCLRLSLGHSVAAAIVGAVVGIALLLVHFAIIRPIKYGKEISEKYWELANDGLEHSDGLLHLSDQPNPKS